MHHSGDPALPDLRTTRPILLDLSPNAGDAGYLEWMRQRPASFIYLYISGVTFIILDGILTR
jgi:hypothetical protein